MPLSRTIYFSENKIGPVGRDAQMAELQKVAVIRNRRHHVTGALAYDNRWFAQALEGETRFVLEAFDRILRDTRHANVKVTSSGLVSERLFGKWSMGFAARNFETELLFGLHWFDANGNPEIMSEENIVRLMLKLGQQGFMGPAQTVI